MKFNFFKFMKKTIFYFSSDTFKFVYQQESDNDVTSLIPVLPCFGLFSSEPLGLYHGILRFTSNKYNFYLDQNTTLLKESFQKIYIFKGQFN